ncbi:unnamed protein product [Tuber aestivum]|uniref:Uncharacterized protein n=1 Tax=Tuber aestivum TaxID=59557 RepID=A0A292PUR9_9PEZI|nr:unnamed protein product [Tuber aestivum]
MQLLASATESRDKDGLRSIPPPTWEFAETCAGDLEDTFHVHIGVERIDEEPGKYTYENGVEPPERYNIDVAEDLVRISGGRERGIWQATRTLRQRLILARKVAGVSQGDWRDEIIELKAGRVVDSPVHPTRAFLLDARRKWYSAGFLKDLCNYVSFSKLSEFRYHTSDNYPLNRGCNNTSQNIYSKFSQLPNNPVLHPLVPRHNEPHNRVEVESIEKLCASQGITITPEIKLPGMHWQ